MLQTGDQPHITVELSAQHFRIHCILPSAATTENACDPAMAVD